MGAMSLSSKRKAVHQLQPSATKRKFLPATQPLVTKRKRVEFVLEDMKDWTLDLEKEYLSKLAARPPVPKRNMQLVDWSHDFEGEFLLGLNQSSPESKGDANEQGKSLQPIMETAVTVSVKNDSLKKETHEHQSQTLLVKVPERKEEEKNSSIPTMRKSHKAKSEVSSQSTIKKATAHANKNKATSPSTLPKPIKITRPKFPYRVPSIPTDIEQEISLLRSSVKVHWKKRKTLCSSATEKEQ